MIKPVRLMRTRETAEMLGVSENTLKAWRQQGRGPKGARMEGILVWREEDVHAWIQAQFDKAVGDDLVQSRQ